jgi:formylglycine-generating enzyme required for sulfatase activity
MKSESKGLCAKENNMTFKFAKQAVILLLLFTLACADPKVVTQESLPSQTPTADAEPFQVTKTPGVVVEPEDVLSRPQDGMNMVYVPGGDFLMGSDETQVDDAIALCNQHYSPCNRWYYQREAPRHPVSLDGFWFDQTEVSNARYRLCVQAGVCPAPAECKKGQPTFDDPAKADHPVVCVDWEDAQAYCQWVGGRLPTEAQWEYAFRGRAGSLFSWGDEFDGSRLNYCDANCSQPHADDRFDDGYPRTAPVGSYPSGASWSGAYNMGGNVSEWVADWFGEYSPDALSNPSGPESGGDKMLKGCSWFSNPAYCRGAARPSVSPATRFDYLGFRCAMPVEKKTQAAGADMLSEPLALPRGKPSALDGTLSPGEWDSARVETFADGSELYLMRDLEFLYLAIRANEAGTIAGNVFIQRGDEISILHSSAALGTAVYQRAESGWGRVRDFTWRCRGTGDSDSARAERAEFLQDEGWLAANGRMGTPNELEYQIRIPDQDFRLAAVYIKSVPPYEKVPWPAGLDDDCIQPTPDGLPDVLMFLPEKWIPLSSRP